MSKAFVGNAADPKQVKDGERKERWKRSDEIGDVQFLLSHPQGRRFFHRYFEKCGLFECSWEASARIHFNEGRRSVALDLLKDVKEANPVLFLEMTLKEHYEIDKDAE